MIAQIIRYNLRKNTNCQVTLDVEKAVICKYVIGKKKGLVIKPDLIFLMP